MSEKKPIFVIIDGNAIIHRAYHALPPLTTKDGKMVNAVYGFTSMLLKVLNDLKPTHIAVTFDVSKKTFRDDLYDKYKATRVKADQELYDQIPLVYDVVRAFGIPIFTKEGFEADDVIGTVVSALERKHKNLELLIVTGDMDMLQLVGDRIKVYALRKGLSDITIFDEAKVQERYGFAPAHITDYKALRGDASDNIPGIRGIGDKTAADLVQRFGGIEELYKKIRNPKSEIRKELKPAVLKKLEAGEEDAKLSKQLAVIHCSIPEFQITLEECERQPLSRDTIIDLFHRFEFPSLLKRLPELGIAGATNGDKPKKSPAKILRVERIESGEIEKVMAALRTQPFFVAKEILSDADIFSKKNLGLLFLSDTKAFYIDTNTLSKEDWGVLKEIFFDKGKVLVGHDVKQLIKALSVHDVTVENPLFDIMIASYLLNSSTRAHDLRAITLRELGKDIASADQGSLFGADPVGMGEELAAMRELYAKYTTQLEERQDMGLFEKMEMRLIPILAKMELAGIAIDTELLETLSKEIARDIHRLTAKITDLAGVEFNVASSTQLRDVLFETLQLPTAGVKKGKTGYSTAASELEKLRGVHPIIELIEEHRELAKLQNTYVDVLPTLVNKHTGRLHTSFNQAVASTGRLSGSDPNLQNIPIRTELGKKIRNAFIAPHGHTLLAADYSQIELRIVASLANDKKMIEIFEQGLDIHQATAAAINGVPLEKVTKEMRYAAKEVNFGVLYGMGAYGLAWRAGISQHEAQEFIKKYFEQFAGVAAYVEQTLKFARKEGYVETLFGRRRHIPELQSGNYQLRQAGERMAVNMPIQGTAADLMKLAMITVDERLESTKVKMLLQVHDELVFEVPEGQEAEIGTMVKAVMEQVTKLRVPVEVHVSHGKRWGDLK